jgi:dihydroxyacetone kinase-like predicted kinase
MLASSPDKAETFKLLTEKLDAKNKEFMIVFMGEDVTDTEKSAVEAIVSEQYPSVEFYALDGGQEVYDFIIILE